MHDISDWQHSHDFTDVSQRDGARRTYWVIALAATTMVVELAAGFWTGSMALLADIKGLEHITIEVNYCTPGICPELSRPV